MASCSGRKRNRFVVQLLSAYEDIYCIGLGPHKKFKSKTLITNCSIISLFLKEINVINKNIFWALFAYH